MSSTVMMVCRVQTNIEFEEVYDDDGDPVELQDNEEYKQKRTAFLSALEKFGAVDVEHEDYY